MFARYTGTPNSVLQTAPKNASARCCGEVFLPPPSEAETKRDHRLGVALQRLGTKNSIAFPTSSSLTFFLCEGPNFEIHPN